MSKKTKSKAQETSTAPQSEVDWAAIEALEKQSRKEAEKQVSQQPAQQESTVTFDEWWMSREADIKKPAYFKEILRVDARARGLVKKELHSRWDWAARQFGLDI